MLNRMRDFRRFWLLIALLVATPVALAQPLEDGQHDAAVVSRGVATELMARLGVARRNRLHKESICLDALLTQANSVRAQVLQHTGRLRVALRDGDSADARRQRALLDRLAERARALDRMAAGCQAARVATHTRVTSIIPDAPRGEPAPL